MPPCHSSSVFQVLAVFVFFYFNFVILSVSLARSLSIPLSFSASFSLSLSPSLFLFFSFSFLICIIPANWFKAIVCLWHMSPPLAVVIAYLHFAAILYFKRVIVFWWFIDSSVGCQPTVTGFPASMSMYCMFAPVSSGFFFLYLYLSAFASIFGIAYHWPIDRLIDRLETLPSDVMWGGGGIVHVLLLRTCMISLLLNVCIGLPRCIFASLTWAVCFQTDQQASVFAVGCVYFASLFA